MEYVQRTKNEKTFRKIFIQNLCISAPFYLFSLYALSLSWNYRFLKGQRLIICVLAAIFAAALVLASYATANTAESVEYKESPDGVYLSKEEDIS